MMMRMSMNGDKKAPKRILVDPMGNRTEEIFDAQDNLLKVTKKDKAGQLLTETELSYDSDGNKVLEKALVLADGKSSKSFDKAWSFDEKSRLQSVTYGSSGSEEQAWRFKYNSYGSLESKHNPGSKEPIIYQYDKYGNLGKVSFPKIQKKQLIINSSMTIEITLGILV